MPNAHMPWNMCECLGWCCQSLDNVACPKCTILGRWCLLFGDIDVTNLMHTRLELCVPAFDDAACRCWKSLARYTQIMLYAWRHCFMLPAVGRCRLADACSPWPMSPNWCAHAMNDVCMPCMMLPDFGWCCLANACKPWSLSLSRYAHAMADASRIFSIATFHWPILLVRCAQTSADINYTILSYHG